MISEKIIKGLNKITAKEKSRFAINHIHKDGIRLVATNGREMLVVSNEDYQSESDTNLIDGKTAEQYIKMKPKNQGMRFATWKELADNNTIINGKEGTKFPDYKAVMKPKMNSPVTKKFSVKGFEAMLQALKIMGCEHFDLTMDEKSFCATVKTTNGPDEIKGVMTTIEKP